MQLEVGDQILGVAAHILDVAEPLERGLARLAQVKALGPDQEDQDQYDNLFIHFFLPNAFSFFTYFFSFW